MKSEFDLFDIIYSYAERIENVDIFFFTAKLLMPANWPFPITLDLY